MIFRAAIWTSWWARNWNFCDLSPHEKSKRKLSSSKSHQAVITMTTTGKRKTAKGFLFLSFVSNCSAACCRMLLRTKLRNFFWRNEEKIVARDSKRQCEDDVWWMCSPDDAEFQRGTRQFPANFADWIEKKLRNFHMNHEIFTWFDHLKHHSMSFRREFLHRHQSSSTCIVFTFHFFFFCFRSRINFLDTWRLFVALAALLIIARNSSSCSRSEIMMMPQHVSVEAMQPVPSLKWWIVTYFNQFTACCDLLRRSRRCHRFCAC